MPIDGIVLSKVKENLDKYLPIRINRISQISKNELVFNVHADGVRTNLVISLHSSFNHICFSNKTYANFNEPSSFVMLLRKYILNGFIYKIEQFDFDRYLLFHIKARNELYDEKHYVLSLELIGKYANLILVDDDNKIIDAFKKIPPYENNHRTIIPAAKFTLVESQNKQNPFEVKNINFDESLVSQLQGFSKILENEIRYRLTFGISFEKILEDLKKANKLYLTKTDDGYEYHIIPLTYLKKDYQEYDIQEGFDLIFSEDDEKERIKIIADDLFKVVRRQIKHYQTKINKLNASLESALNLMEDKENGELLYIYPNLDEKGLKEVLINDYEEKKHLIKLDPKLSIKENANKYFNNYQKKRKGQVYIKEQIELANHELEYFNALNEQLSYADYLDALDIKEELNSYNYLKKNNKKNKKKKLNSYQIKYQDYIIRFGKNNLQNNNVTFDYAKSNYTWFHAKDYHGSHVVINSNELNEDAIRLCANIAAYYSKGRYSSSVPVNYCLAKDVKKIKGAKLGFVSIKNYKTIYVDPIEIKDLTIEVI